MYYLTSNSENMNSDIIDTMLQHHMMYSSLDNDTFRVNNSNVQLDKENGKVQSSEDNFPYAPFTFMLTCSIELFILHI